MHARPRAIPGYARPPINLGNAHAVPGFVAALRLEPADAKAHAGLGDALAGLDRTTEAIAELTESVRLSPNFVDARRNLGLARAQHHGVAEAIHEFREVLRLAPNDPTAHRLLTQITGQ